ncbi:MAG: hypothetical protein Q7S02_05455 [bacterium]|nr:hypothetical protein [bacterium]
MPRESFATFGPKFMDIMVGVVLGLGFQWWPDLREPWQFIAFVFVYLNLIDYWIDYSPTLKKFPPRRELDVMIDVFIVFTMFLLVYATKVSVVYLFGTFIVYRIADLLWVWRIRREHTLDARDERFASTWFRFDIIEAIAASIFAAASLAQLMSPLIATLIFVVFRVTTRFLASLRYRSVFYFS